MSSLDSVLRYRQHLLAQRKAELAKAIQADNILAAQLDEQAARRSAVSAEAAAASRSGRLDVAAVASRLVYAGQLNHESAGVRQQRAVVAAEIARCRGEVAQADADVKAIENILAKRAAEARKTAMRKQQIVIEENFAATKRA